MNRRSIRTALGLVLALVGWGPAQDLPSPGEVDPELQSLETTYAEEIIKSRKSIGSNYLNALRRLQKDLSSRRQIEQALLVKRERERVLELLEQAPIVRFPTAGSRPLQRVQLDLASARCSGGTLYDDRRKNLRNWTAAGGAVTWGLDADMPPGRYDVIIGYNAGRDAGGAFKVVVGDGQRASADVRTTDASNWKTNAEMLAGSVAIDPDSRTLKIVATALRKPYLWTVRSVRLEPAGTWAKRKAAKRAGGSGSIRGNRARKPAPKKGATNAQPPPPRNDR